MFNPILENKAGDGSLFSILKKSFGIQLVETTVC